jgi:hypothetical protein
MFNLSQQVGVHFFLQNNIVINYGEEQRRETSL